jgi:phosphoribosylglycinamide formyltransferase-1
VTTRLVVLASGNGSNLQAIIDACETQVLHAQVVGVVSDNHHAFALQRGWLGGN